MNTANNITVFLNKTNLRNPNRHEIVCKAYPSRWGGVYGKSHYDSRVNLSDKKMEERGFRLAEITRQEFKRLQGLEAKRRLRMEAKRLEMELTHRAEAVTICLSAEPLPVVSNEGGNPFVRSVVDLAGTPMIEAYHGCRKGTAYVRGGHLIAFHYGHRQPHNAPSGDGVTAMLCELSCTQVCL